MNNLTSKSKIFLRRTSDCKFFRGARFWKWAKSWRHAALLERGFWATFVIPKLEQQGIAWEYATLDDIN
jgi:hypothetical protein